MKVFLWLFWILILLIFVKNFVFFAQTVKNDTITVINKTTVTTVTTISYIIKVVESPATLLKKQKKDAKSLNIQLKFEKKALKKLRRKKKNSQKSTNAMKNN